MDLCHRCGKEPICGRSRRSWCRTCSNEYDADWRRKNREENTERLLDYLLEHPCVDCAEKDPIVLEFHHVDASRKMDAVARLLDAGWKNVLREIEKCVVLCANCHRRRTAKQAHWRMQSLIEHREELM